MTTSLLSTKWIAPPLSPGLIERPRLLHSLDAGLRPGNLLTLVCSAAMLLLAWRLFLRRDIRISCEGSLRLPLLRSLRALGRRRA